MGAPKGILSERLQKLLIDANPTEPYEVTDRIVVAPLTKKRSQGLADAQMGLGVANVQLQKAMARAAPPRPEYPAPPTPPGRNATPAVTASYEEAVTAWKVLADEWEALQQSWEDELKRHEEVIQGYAEQMKEHSEQYTRHLFGNVCDQVIAYFDDQPVELWNVFVEDVKDAFGLNPKPSQLPEDGVCPTCGAIEDEEQAGKAPESST